MNLHNLAKDIRNGYKELKNNITFKSYICRWDLSSNPVVEVENDAEFKGIIIGDTRTKKSRGYMYLFCTNDRKEKFPSIAEIERRLKIVANGDELKEDNCSYHNWKEYGSLEKQRNYFKEILTK